MMNSIIPIGGAQQLYGPMSVGSKAAGNIGAFNNVGGADLKGSAIPFKTMFQDALSQVETLEAVKAADTYNLSIGNLDNLAEMMVNTERAQTAFQLMVQMRNKVLDAYSEIMRMNV